MIRVKAKIESLTQTHDNLEDKYDMLNYWPYQNSFSYLMLKPF